MEVDPEALIKCTTITPGGVASSTPAVQGEKVPSINYDPIYLRFIWGYIKVV